MDYKHWREGQGFKKGTVVQVKSMGKPKEFIITRITEIIPPMFT